MVHMITTLFSIEDDYFGIQRLLTFNSTFTEATIVVALRNDAIPEDTESFILSLMVQEDSSIVVIPDQMIISIIDDDREGRALYRITFSTFYMCFIYKVIIILQHE